MAATPPRARPGTPARQKRYHRLLDGRPDVRRSAAAPPDALPWALVTGVDPRAGRRAVPDGGVLRGARGDLRRLRGSDRVPRAGRHVRERAAPGDALRERAGPPRDARRSDDVPRAFERALRRLRYGTVAVNTWTGYGFGFGTTPWGGFPGQPLTDVRSGRGFVHNTLMLEGVEKTVIRHPVDAPDEVAVLPDPPHAARARPAADPRSRRAARGRSSRASSRPRCAGRCRSLRPGAAPP